MTKEKITFNIAGMHCAGCAARLTNVLERLPGVQSTHVNHANGRAEVEYDEGATGFDQMKEAVEKAGYSAERDT